MHSSIPSSVHLFQDDCSSFRPSVPRIEENAQHRMGDRQKYINTIASNKVMLAPIEMCEFRRNIEEVSLRDFTEDFSVCFVLNKSLK